MLLEAFTPVFRTHEGLLPEENIQIYSDSLVIQAFKTFSTINHALLPYFKQLIKERKETGKPIFSEIAHTIKGFETTNPGFCVGSQIMIIHQLEKEDFKSLIKWNLLKSLIVLVFTGSLKIFLPLTVDPCQLSVSLLTGVLGAVTLSFCLRK